jgi:hypothetical protein
MPRDLFPDKKSPDAMPELSREPETVSSPESVEQSSLVPHRSSNIAQEGRLKQMGVRPYTSLLNIDDLDDCDWLEHAAFDPVEAASREKVRTTNLLSVLSLKHHGQCLYLLLSTAVGLRQASRHALFSITMLLKFSSLPTVSCLVSIQCYTKHQSTSCIHHRDQSSLSCASWLLFPISLALVLRPFLL